MRQFLSVDLETELIGPGAIFPEPICIAWGNGTEQKVSKAVEEKFSALAEYAINRDVVLVFHNSSFDLNVLVHHYPKFKETILKLCKKKLISDTMIIELLLDLSTSGTTIQKPLSSLAKKYLEKDISDSKQADGIRYRYGEYKDIPIQDWPEEAINYAKQDVLVTWQVRVAQSKAIRPEGVSSANTEALQIMAAFALGRITDYGIMIDQDRVQELKKKFNDIIDEPRQVLLANGFLEKEYKTHKSYTMNRCEKCNSVQPREEPKCMDCGLKTHLKKMWKVEREFVGYKKNCKKLRDYLQQIYPSMASYTTSGQVELGVEKLELYPPDVIISNYISLIEYEKMLTSYIPSLEEASPTLHPDFSVLKETGRTSSTQSSNYPSINIQQIPKDFGIRECFIPRPGHYFLSIDYSGLELVSASQSMINIFGKGNSEMARYLNAGDSPQDLHALLGAKIYSLQQKRTVPVEEFRELKKTDPETYSKFRTMAKPLNLGYPGGIGPKTMVATCRKDWGFELSIQEATLFRETFFELYPEFVRFFKSWIPAQKQKEKRYVKSTGIYEETYAYSTNTRYRAGCSFTSIGNGKSMQSLAADGAKLAIINCYDKINLPAVAFIHDELIFEIPKTYTEALIEETAQVMISSMQKVTPDIRVTAEASVMERWTKSGPFLFNKSYWSDSVR